MANGFFLGGMASGIQAADKQSLADRTQVADTALRTRGYDISEKHHADDIALRKRALSVSEGSANRAERQKMIEQVEGRITNTMGIVNETIKGGVTAGRDPAQIQAAVAPLLDSVKGLASRIGRDPKTFDAMVNAQLFKTATPEEEGTAEGVKAGAKTVATDKAIAASGADPNAIKDPAKRVEAEAKLRDDYSNSAKSFVTVRDYYSNFKSAENTGAGDITRVFAFMKVNDPGSAVLPGEAANANNAAGVPESVRAMYNNLIGGGKLGPGAREQLNSQVEKLYQARAKMHDRSTTEYANIAKRQGLNPNNVIVNILPAGADAAVSRTPGGTTFRIIQ